MNSKKFSWKEFRHSFAGKGYYIALILCAVAIGIAGYMYYVNTSDTPDGPDLPAIATKPTDSQTTTTPDKDKLPMRVTAPVTGQTVMHYAMDCLVYNPTTRDWRVHNGIDIAAEAGTEVCAAADGTVYTVYEDEAYGTTVVVRHDGGFVTMYASLDKNVPVKTGDKVVMGQTIGKVANSALLETAVGDHLHFCVTHNESSMDPAEFLELG
jgi:murein DD-endopeptidase MepM/ murein hydrolase activator NlpD